jgi:hypothetical protein
MKVNRICIETVIFGTAIALACALLIAILAAAGAVFTQAADAEVLPKAPISQSSGAAVAASPASTPSQTFEGMVTCSQCGAKHSATLARNAADCARRCVRAGASFALIDGEKIYALDGDLMAIKKLAGQRARLTGELRGEQILVASIAAAD